METHEQAATDAQSASTEAANQGPPSDLPGAVPDFVGEIHSSISEFIGGGIESLGSAVGGAASSNGVAEVAAAAVDVAMVSPV
jgi:hypothetical protein